MQTIPLNIMTPLTLTVLFNRLLVSLLGSLGISQADIARELGLSRSHVSSWYVGRRKLPDPYYATLICLIKHSLEHAESTKEFASIQHTTLEAWQLLATDARRALMQAHTLCTDVPVGLSASQWTPCMLRNLLQRAEDYRAYSQIWVRVCQFPHEKLTPSDVEEGGRACTLQNSLPSFVS